MEKQKKVIVYDVQDEVMGVQAISLVDEPAIMSNFVYLSEEKKVKLSNVDTERKMVYGAVLIPDMHILRVDKQTGEEYYITFTRECIMQAAHLYLKKNLLHNHTLQHEVAVTGLTVVESWIKESDQDKSVMLGLDVPVGTWLAGVKIENDAVLEQVKAGNVKGFSIEGMFSAATEELTAYINDDLLIAELEELLKSL